VSWTALPKVDPKAITIATVPELLAKRKADPWADLLKTHQRLPKELLI
jgi:DNA primase